MCMVYGVCVCVHTMCAYCMVFGVCICVPCVSSVWCMCMCVPCVGSVWCMVDVHVCTMYGNVYDVCVCV